jgi:hypothetical protein
MKLLMFRWSVPLQYSHNTSSLQAAGLLEILVNTYIHGVMPQKTENFNKN